MSEFTKLSRRIDELGKRIETYRVGIVSETWEGKNPNEADMGKIGLEIEESLVAVNTKFFAKMNSVDAVSNTPRYGDTMKGKIVDAQALATSNSHAYHELKLVFDAAFARVRDVVLQKELAKAEADKKKNTATVFTSVTFSASASSVLQAAKEEDEATRLANQKLHEDAERAREAKRIRQAFKSSLSDLLPRLMYEQSLLWTHIGLDVVFDMLLAKASLDRRQGVDILKFLAKILDQILSKPDQIALRKLRLNHNTIWEQITRHSHSLFLLIYCGFTMSLEPIKPDSTDYNDEIINYWYAIMESSGNPDIYTLFDISQLSNRQIIDLSTSVGYVPVMEMREPSINTQNGLAEWTSWFDRIKAKRGEIEALIRSS